MKNTKNNKKIILKITALVLIMQMLILGGCSLKLSSKTLSSRYKSAVEFADYWFGASEDTGSYPVDSYSGDKKIKMDCSVSGAVHLLRALLLLFFFDLCSRGILLN